MLVDLTCSLADSWHWRFLSWVFLRYQLLILHLVNNPVHMTINAIYHACRRCGECNMCLMQYFAHCGHGSSMSSQLLVITMTLHLILCSVPKRLLSIYRLQCLVLRTLAKGQSVQMAVSSGLSHSWRFDAALLYNCTWELRGFCALNPMSAIHSASSGMLLWAGLFSLGLTVELCLFLYTILCL